MLCVCVCVHETNPVRNEMVQAQAVGVRVILPCKLIVVDLGELEGCKTTFNIFSRWPKLFRSVFLLFVPLVESVRTPVPTLPGSREEHLRLQPDGPVRVHGGRGGGVGQAHQVLPLLLLQGETMSVLLWSPQRGNEELTLWTSRGMTYRRTSGCGAIMAAFFTSSQLALRLANHR